MRGKLFKIRYTLFTSLIDLTHNRDTASGLMFMKTSGHPAGTMIGTWFPNRNQSIMAGNRFPMLNQTAMRIPNRNQATTGVLVK